MTGVQTCALPILFWDELFYYESFGLFAVLILVQLAATGAAAFRIYNNGIKILILDTSAACHMPDVLEMPYRPPLMDSGEPGEKKYTYRLSSCTCLAGDVIGDYSFDREIKTGDRLCFCDMAIYSMVKNNTFNGMPLPDIAVMDENNDCKVIRRFEYGDFKCRLS